ncbi:glycoside hydrolase family 15 protein [Labilibaculum antarcticum]|uniref:Glycoside hydrolase n=1 Tax=Labilibaculum antarcticum TaxID=1717717 RepID=A0A1Y1CF73_9BACT|nr:glycoside hydrolase family 15 protein [Labilibaculum antarcticum]BAX78999.1 glycoside hydrolase [Labilibaculum antarcticum]
MGNLNYGVIGNCRSAALISEKGSLDWVCLPQFDSSSAFAKLLDENKGGSFEILPENATNIIQEYGKNTNILKTRFECVDGVFEVLDFMPRYVTDENNYYMPPDVVRFFRLVYGKPKFRIKYNPKLDYARNATENKVSGVEFLKSSTTSGSYDSLYLYSSFNYADILNQNVIELDKDEFCEVSYNQKLLEQTRDRIYLKLQRTKTYWLNWSEKTKVLPKYNEEANRSALVLKLLSYQKSGAVMAAITTSLPETIGEVRNWDYRFCWIRDGSMVVKILTQLGHFNVAKRYLNFIMDIIPKKNEKIQIMYGINGEKKLSEYELEHLAGYEGSKPVRVGNAAYKQKQNDIYGILLDLIHQHFEIFETSLEHSEELWTIVRSIVKVVEENWKKPDRGIWEIRGKSLHFTFSKVMCWVAFDRAVKIAVLLKRDDYVGKWTVLRNLVKDDIMKKAWSEKKQAFTQNYGSEDMDASVLLMESYGFIDAADEKYKSTVFTIQKELEHDGLMYRYKNQDDFGTPKSAFTICSFWLINSLYKIGKRREAKEKFDKLLTYSNHLGLFAEDIDFVSKRMLGNFPQAYSHLAIIETALNFSNTNFDDEDSLLDQLNS